MVIHLEFVVIIEKPRVHGVSLREETVGRKKLERQRMSKRLYNTTMTMPDDTTARRWPFLIAHGCRQRRPTSAPFNHTHPGEHATTLSLFTGLHTIGLILDLKTFNAALHGLTLVDLT
ncbi:hypothetical protein ZIOFF_065430 [Zingiber officinale]|uniref:Uncharacterized protein n=1 Tax=Zingiber officinale TaxID=94328 RepID=A0A8J5EXB6_ZINOF|nr:hypothetical protein ZIOFF_065430 [Zingiber officinale]